MITNKPIRLEFEKPIRLEFEKQFEEQSLFYWLNSTSEIYSARKKERQDLTFSVYLKIDQTIVVLKEGSNAP